MKKIMIIAVSAIYFVAVILVAFLGYQSEIHGQPIYAEDIILNYESMPYTHYENGAPIYEVIQNPNYNKDSENPEDHYKYNIHFMEFEYFYEIHGKFEIPALPVSTKGDVSDKTISYLIDKDKSNYVEVDDKGIITFKQYLENYIFSCSLKSKDGSNVSIAIRFYW